ncbi:hypothetical protein [Kitasatospora arboriphila]|uniref:Uncharacterized protein n=1 Tax=Kitasatospora arboriphila TaxID=258052 RepID=A0ABN1TY87_9ACTN
MSTPTPNPSNQSGPTPFLTLRTVVVLLAAAVIGLVVGGLTFLSTRSAAGAVLAGLTAFGASVLGLHKLIG